jgi:hypothetical protein
LDPLATGSTTTKPIVETRNNGIQKVQVDFNGAMTLVNSADITVTYYPTTPQSPATVGSPTPITPTSVAMADADTLNINFASGLVPNLGCLKIVIGAGTFNETVTGDNDCIIRALIGDVNASGTVSSPDILSTKNEAQLGSDPHTAGKAKFDVNLSGIISSPDFLLIKSKVMTPANTALCP